MIKLPTHCRSCLYVTTADCTCIRCTAVKAGGFCGSNCRNDFYEELEDAKRRAS